MADVRRALGAAVVLLAALTGCSDVAADELSADEVCDNQPESPFLTVEAVSDERGAGLAWSDVTMGRFQDQTFRLHSRPAGSDDAWEEAGDVVLTPDDTREVVPVDLPPGRWEVGITHLDPVCGESELCFLDECSSAVVEVATEPERTS
ncbi:hypothetical protein [Cellulomonas xiejunii]|uniref:Lipoprotein n=1 Tax=Cellulomonas xiejunii TaxID=2968083 RepID=A0ABY5KK49_9CELL|nr:hypothetical protein [Cellulomonas xiejunii]MCC2313194.1 hypothetical protein [Cellulomonas xiejunii]MCC2319891.1 hypothetical protein [Cellulomonas xiejunii]UUI70215.1 hypothetical protein NP048_10315 [Cellulomonas xiejunii]